MLRSAHLCAPVGIPILGVNLGRLGFLIQVGRDEWQAACDDLLKGEFWIENRMMIRAEHKRSDESLGNWHALNEVVVSRGASVHPVHLSTSVDGMLLTNYVADGLIASTPTGSTAYALAAGGPILPPELRNILLVPIAPHLSVDRAVVLSEGASVTITLRDNSEAVLERGRADPDRPGQQRPGGGPRRGLCRPLRALRRPRLLLPQPDRPHEPESCHRSAAMI